MKKSFIANRLLSIALFIIVMAFVTQATAKEITTGLYGVWAWNDIDAAIKMVSDNKFDVIVTYPNKKILDKAYNKGLKCIVNINLTKAQANDNLSWNSYLDQLKKMINEYKDHPAILAWYPVDEPDGQKIPVERIKAIYQMIKSIDPVHPVFTVLSSPDNWSQYLSYFDIISIDPYLLRYKDGSVDTPAKVKKYIDAMKKDLNTLKLTKPIWVTLGAFEQKQVRSTDFDPYKKPTNAEFDQMISICISENVDGILVFTFASKSNNDVKEWKLPNDPLWDVVKKYPAILQQRNAR